MTNVQDIAEIILNASKRYSAHENREVQLGSSDVARIAKALDEAGFYRCDVCPFDCDSCHDEDCPCDRLGCAGSEAPGAK